MVMEQGCHSCLNLKNLVSLRGCIKQPIRSLILGKKTQVVGKHAWTSSESVRTEQMHQTITFDIYTGFRQRSLRLHNPDLHKDYPVVQEENYSLKLGCLIRRFGRM